MIPADKTPTGALIGAGFFASFQAEAWMRMTRLLQLGETQSGAEPQNAGVLEEQHAGGDESWCHV